MDTTSNESVDHEDGKAHPFDDPDPISKSDLVDLIDFEIAQRRVRNQQAGWTPWALWGALGVLLWLFSDSFSAAPFWALANAVIALELFYMAAAMGVRFLGRKQVRVDGITLFSNLHDDLIEGRNTSLLAAPLYTVATILIAWSPELPSWARFVGCSWFGVIVLGSIALLVLSFLPRLDVFVASKPREPKRLNRAQRVVTAMIALLIMAVPITVGWQLILSLDPVLLQSTSVWKGALLAIGIVRILHLLAVVPIHSPVDEALHEIRRELTRGRIPVSLAARVFDSLVGGVSTHRLLNDHSVSFVMHAARTIAFLQEMESRLIGLFDDEGKFRKLPDDIVTAVLATYDADVSGFLSATVAMAAEHRRLERFVNHVASQGGDPLAIAQFRRQLEELAEEANKSLESLVAIHKRVMDEVAITNSRNTKTNHPSSS
jgi:hypothetical protein